MRQSPPLNEILRGAIKVSQNLHAEMLLREVGLCAYPRERLMPGFEKCV